MWCGLLGRWTCRASTARHGWVRCRSRTRGDPTCRRTGRATSSRTAAATSSAACTASTSFATTTSTSSFCRPITAATTRIPASFRGRAAATFRTGSSSSPTWIDDERFVVALSQRVELHLHRRASEILRAATAPTRAAAAARHLYAGLAAPPFLVEDALRGTTAHDRVGDLIGLLFVTVADLADPAIELDARFLLHHVRGFVRRQPKIRRTAEGDAIADRVRARA
jgi:hypothetical protein